MLVKLIFLEKSEEPLTKLETCSLSREIGFRDHARIIEFGSKGREAGLQYLGVDS
jgi:hypothetical protein